MSEEIQEAVQIIRVAYDGIEIAMKVGSGGIAAMQKALDVLTALLDYEKSIGRTNMRKLLLKGGDLQVFQFRTNEMKKVEKMLKSYGILYSVLPDINTKDGLSEIIFHTEAVPRVNMLIQKLNHGKIATFEDYLKNGDEKGIGKLMSFLKGQKRGNEVLHTGAKSVVNDAVDNLIEKVGLFAAEKKDISVDAVKEEFRIDHQRAQDVLKHLVTIGMLAKRDEDGLHKVLMDKESFGERIRGYHDLAERMRAVAKSNDPNLVDITISKKLIADRSENAIKTRIPGAWGDHGRYVWLEQENVMDIHNGKTLLTFIDLNKDYMIYDLNDRVVETIKGEKLYEHYDKVEAKVRERYEKTAVKEKSKRTAQTEKSKRR